MREGRGEMPGVLIPAWPGLQALRAVHWGAVLGLLIVVLGVVGCGTAMERGGRGSSGGGGRSSAGGWTMSGLSPALDQQRKLMAQTFSGTGVGIEVTQDKALKITVPAKHSFESNRYAIKPALAKVMERLAPGVARNPDAVLQIWAPEDAQASAGLQAERRESLRDMAIARGVALSRLQVSTDPAPGGAVTELLVTEKRP